VVLPGTAPADELIAHLASGSAIAVLKLGRTFERVRAALQAAGRLGEAWYVERASTPQQRVARVTDVDASTVPYFSMIVVPGAINNPLARLDASPPRGVTVVGLGPGPGDQQTPQVRAALASATDLIGYTTYLARVTTRPGQQVHASDNRVESQRAEFALDLARRGRRVVVVSSGDPGVFAMAAAVAEVAAEEQYADVPVRVLPGVTAASAVAAAFGAPLGHDLALISLSDRLKPWDVIARRITAAVDADLVLAIYNPGSVSRNHQVADLKSLLLDRVAPDRVLLLGRDVGGPTELLTVTTVGEFDPTVVDMRTLIIVGSSLTTVVQRPGGRLVFTPRHYGR
jgi:precorrin-2 C20-methyltransferase/precorrin-3B C17-methyltransferase